MSKPLELHPDRLFPIEPSCRDIARGLYKEIADLPIISPHGHTDPSWFADNKPFRDAHSLFIAPDHYLLRMLYSQGLRLSDLGIAQSPQEPQEPQEKVASPRSAWQLFARHYHLFRATPTGLWLDHVFQEIFGISQRLDESTADDYYDRITDQLHHDEFRPRRIVDRFNIEFLATTEAPTDTLDFHRRIKQSDWSGRVVTSYRPDCVIDAQHHKFRASLARFAELTGEDVYCWDGYLNAHRKRRADFIQMGATATDHGHPSAQTADLDEQACRALFQRIVSQQFSTQDAELFRAQMLTEMAKMSLDDGLVLQIHPGSWRNHNAWLFQHYGSDLGADIPQRIDYTAALKPLLDRFGNRADLTVILFTLDESNYARELAPLAGIYPCLKLGPPWWFHDSPQGIRRFREQTTETAGFYNTVGFNDDTRALLSIPARHDMARRVDCGYLARLVCEHTLTESEAHDIAMQLTYQLPKSTYRVD